MADDGALKLFVYSFVGLGVGVYLFFKGFTWLREKRLIENTPTSKIRSLAMGRVEIFGKVVAEAKKKIKSPFSGADCVYCKWTIEEYRSQGKSSRWVIVKEGVETNHFNLRDNTGKVLVDPKGSQLDIPVDFESKKLTEPIKKYLDGEAIKYKSWLGFNKSLRFREYYLAPGDEVYVMGSAGDNPFVEDGSAQNNVDDIMIQKGKSDFYYISDKPETAVLKKFKWKVLGGFLGGGALIVVCLFYIFFFIGIL
jgi:hypothetical protein